MLGDRRQLVTMEVVTLPPQSKFKRQQSGFMDADLVSSLQGLKTAANARRHRMHDAMSSRACDNALELVLPCIPIVMDWYEDQLVYLPSCLLSAKHRAELQLVLGHWAKVSLRAATKSWRDYLVWLRDEEAAAIASLKRRVRQWRLRRRMQPLFATWRGWHYLITAARLSRWLQQRRGITTWRRVARERRVRDRVLRRASKKAGAVQVKLHAALLTWRDHALPMIRVRNKLQVCLRVMRPPERREKRHNFRNWRLAALHHGTRRRALQQAWMRMTPRGRMLFRGLRAFAQLKPQWERLSAHTKCSSGKCKVTHTRGRNLDGAIGSPRIRPGIYSSYQFRFLVGGGGSGVVVGVTDADLGNEGGAERLNGATVWGLSLTHGALYTKKGMERATLGNQTLAPPLAAIGKRDCLVVNVEINTKTNRIAFAMDDDPFIQADAELPEVALRPFAFMWNVDDAIVVLPRDRPLQFIHTPEMQPARVRVPVSERHHTKPSPKRLPPPSVESRAPLSPTPITPASPNMSTVRSYNSRRHGSPRRVPYPVRHEVAGALPPEDAPHVHRRPMMRCVHPEAATSACTTGPKQLSSSGVAQRPPSATVSGRTKPLLTPASTSRQTASHMPTPAASHRSAVSGSFGTSSGDYGRTSRSQANKRRLAEEATPHLFEFSLGVFETSPRQSPRDKPRSNMWDAVRRVTGLYMDVYRQL